MAALKNGSYFGGVRSNNTMSDEYGFAFFLDYFAHQMMVMVMYAASCLDDNPKENERFDNAVELVEEERRRFQRVSKRGSH